MMAFLEAQGIAKHFKSVQAVAGVDLALDTGEIYGLVGPDGAGKTTTLRLLCGALRLDQGRVQIGGYDVARQTEQARALLGYLPQRFSLYEDLTVLENIRFFAEIRGLPASEWRPRCMEILAFVGLEAFSGRLAGHLSGGMKQKLGLAAALVHRPRLLLLDEPTTGVDPVTRQDFWQLIIRLAADRENGGVAVLVSTPYMDEAARCTRLGFMRQGQIFISGSPATLRSRLAGRILELRGRPLAQLRELASRLAAVEAVQTFGDRLHLRVQPGAQEEIAAQLAPLVAAAGAQVSGLRPLAPQLEDVFIALVEEAGNSSPLQ